MDAAPTADIEFFFDPVCPFGFPGFAEMKRSMREAPQLNVSGGVSEAPKMEDWKGGHRAGHLPHE